MSRSPAAPRAFDAEEVVTSAPPVALPAPSTPALSKLPATPPATGVDLTHVEAFGDLPDDARDAFARAAVVQDLAPDQEVSGFALALVLEGAVDLSATIVDACAKRLEAGAVLRKPGRPRAKCSERQASSRDPRTSAPDRGWRTSYAPPATCFRPWSA
jgi:hypothetical protein